jgi:NAD(P)-dependent dehydrogenase (short-subunit alcohol dehydrogenase family)
LLLLPTLRASSQVDNNTGHLLIVTSEAHRWLEAKDIPETAQHGGNLLIAMNTGKDYDAFVQYATSKLLAMYVARSLAELATNDDGMTEVIVTAVCPGACKSDLMRDLQGRGYLQTMQLTLFLHLFNKPTEQGAWSYMWASLLGNEGHGKWFKTTRLVE